MKDPEDGFRVFLLLGVGEQAAGGMKRAKAVARVGLMTMNRGPFLTSAVVFIRRPYPSPLGGLLERDRFIVHGNEHETWGNWCREDRVFVRMAVFRVC
ncbi:hypothetical protein B5M42_009845 [Paenibacillus athensensis]|uniref:Uncharacterized protein n=1 Tax=Paenibacillus athensensis TaxID=1967502 RepID=A0A4Y8PPW1_9BACL|nr:hypothetical protein [Paenibacillus athensensis]MCD1259140.1 hypothetical protein [Paenibacillus athensensis]